MRRVAVIFVISLLPLGGCAVVSAGGAVVSAAGSVVGAAASATGSAIDAVAGSSCDDGETKGRDC